jgi:hypothetical protein
MRLMENERTQLKVLLMSGFTEGMYSPKGGIFWPSHSSHHSCMP